MPARTWPLLGLLIILAAAAIELAMGREPWCRCGTIRLWANAVNSAENSQQVADWDTIARTARLGNAYAGAMPVAQLATPHATAPFDAWRANASRTDY